MEPCVEAEEEDGRMVTPEMEAVEALAALASCSAARGGASVSESPCQKEPTTVAASRQSSQDEPIAVFRGNAYAMVTSALNTEETVRIEPHKLCSTSYQSSPFSKLRKNLTEAEKEARRLRRVLANRESARQTIRRRQAMQLELTRKAADLSEENENLKKEKELAVKEYNSLKGRNEFLKLQMADVKKAERREIQEAPNCSQAEIATSATTISLPTFLYNQPSSVPFFWPLVPSSNVVQLQYASHSDVASSSQLSTLRKNTSSSHLGQNFSLGITEPGSPLFVFPVSWLLQFPGYSAMHHSYSGTNNRRNETPSTHQCSMSSSSDIRFMEDNRESSSNPEMWMESSRCARSISVVDNVDHYTGIHSEVTLLVPEKSSCVGPVESNKPTRNSKEDNIYILNASSATDHMSQSSPEKNPEPIICRDKNSENAAATKARRRRKELMWLKNFQNHHVRSHSANCQVSLLSRNGACA